MLTPEQIKARRLDNEIAELRKENESLKDALKKVKGGWAETLRVFATHGKVSYSDKVKMRELAEELEA